MAKTKMMRVTPKEKIMLETLRQFQVDTEDIMIILEGGKPQKNKEEHFQKLVDHYRYMEKLER